MNGIIQSICLVNAVASVLLMLVLTRHKWDSPFNREIELRPWEFWCFFSFLVFCFVCSIGIIVFTWIAK